MENIFEQYFDETSCTYTYLLGDLKDKVAIFIDTVKDCVERDLEKIREFQFDQVYLINTHVHADHITGNASIKDILGNSRTKSIISKYYKTARADLLVDEADELKYGCFTLNLLHTPGHTSGCLSIVDHNNRRVFTGDTLLIRGCGRTDFQGGSAEDLYKSVHEKLFTLPPDYKVYPAHDYNGRKASSIDEEIRLNPRLTKPLPEFVEIMSSLNLAYPKMIDQAVPLNLNCGYGNCASENKF